MLGIVAALAGCAPTSRGVEEGARIATAREERVASQEPQAAAPSVRRSGPAGAATVGSVPVVTLVGEVGSGVVEPVVQNHDAAPVKLAGTLAVERESGTAFAPLTDALTLRHSCEAPAPHCVELVPGAELRPPPWRAPDGHAQCGGGAAPRSIPGRYRFVARTCDGGARVEGEPFELR